MTSPPRTTQRQPLVNTADVIAAGLAAGTVGAVASVFGPPATLAAGVLTAMAGTACTSIYKAYLATPEGDLGRDRDLLVLLAAALLWSPSWLLSRRSRGRRAAALKTALIAGASVSVIVIVAITAIELTAGKNLSCWIWKQCPDGDESQWTSIMVATSGLGVDGVPAPEPDPGVLAPEPDPGVPAPDPDPGVPDPIEVFFYPDIDGDQYGAGVAELHVPGSEPPGMVQQYGDNCPEFANPDQADFDGDGVGDVCDVY